MLGNFLDLQAHLAAFRVKAFCLEGRITLNLSFLMP